MPTATVRSPRGSRGRSLLSAARIFEMTERELMVIDSEAGLAPITERWRELAEIRGNAFVTPEWFLAAVRSTDAGAEPAVQVVWDGDGSLLGVLPLVRSGGGLRFCGARLGDRF